MNVSKNTGFIYFSIRVLYDVPDVPILYYYIHLHTLYNYIWNPPFLSPTLKPLLATETEASGKGGLGGSTRGAGTQ